MSADSELFRQLSELLNADLDLSARGAHQPSADIDRLCAPLARFVEQQSIVYTAFDGDHFHLCGHMRRHVISLGGVPANPESVLGYRDTVMARLTKRGVLLDDITVLSGCDEMCVFTELRPELASISSLAEGVVTELLFFLKRKPHARIRFVSPVALLRSEAPAPQEYPYSYKETHDALHTDQREGILDLANSGNKVDSELRTIAYHIMDPLDFKYAQWLRSHGYNEHQVPLIPGLAIDVGDAPSGQIVAAWATLLRLAHRAATFPMMDPRRTPSTIATLLELLWLRIHGAGTISRYTWTDYPIPKAQLGNRWPLTKHEGGFR